MDDYFFLAAKDWTNRSENAYRNSHYLQSWLLTAPARVCFAIDALVSALYFGVAGIFVCLKAPVALYYWNLDRGHFSYYTENAIEKYFRIFSSGIGILSTNLGQDQDNPFSFSLGLVAAVGAVGSVCALSHTLYKRYTLLHR